MYDGAVYESAISVPSRLDNTPQYTLYPRSARNLI